MSSDANRNRSERIRVFRESTPMVLPSVLNADFGDLGGELQRLTDAGARALHLDVMDGHFVPNLTFGMPIVEGLRRHTDLPLDVHLMISDPLRYAGPMVDAGADMLTFHVEAVDDPAAAAQSIADLGVAVGVAINPDASMDQLEPCLDHVDMVLIMSVQAGFGGQAFNPIALERLRSLRNQYPDLLLEADGGIKASNIADVRAAGCDCFVVGSAILKSDDYGKAIDELNDQIASANPSGANISPGQEATR
ncbi:ribulose-phosphate 3-epimerase [Crateriforma conspicua]|nr:ribulose-phosphate 3-epimerase [Crateriforma conspicua]